MIVYIARHGQPRLSHNWESDPEFPRGDPPLSPLGRTQARLLGQRLRKRGFRGTIYASPYYRTAETADLIAQELGLTFYLEAAIREVVKESTKMIGFMGRSLETLRSTLGCIAQDAVLGYPWWTIEAETPETVLARVQRFLTAGKIRDGDIMLVGHGASVSAAIHHLLDDHPDVLARVENNWNCGLTAIQIEPEFRALLLADTSHMEPDQVTSNAKTRQMWLEERQALGHADRESFDLTQ